MKIYACIVPPASLCIYISILNLFLSLLQCSCLAFIRIFSSQLNLSLYVCISYEDIFFVVSLSASFSLSLLKKKSPTRSFSLV